MSLSSSEQSRINGAKSRGPKTAQGKTISSLNALKHGRFAKHTACLFFESSEDYDQLVEDLAAQFRPATNNEHRLVEQLAAIQFSYQRTQLAITTYIERLFRYASAQRLEIPETSNPMDVLVAAEEEALIRSPYIRFKSRQASQLLADQNRVLRALKNCKRDFPAATPDPEPARVADPEIPRLVEPPENFKCYSNVDFFPKPHNKSATSSPICSCPPIGTNPSHLPPQSPGPNPSTPPIPLPEAA